MQVILTGGAGFIGSNVTAVFLRDAHRVTILDSLTRPGSERNLEWLRSQYFRNTQKAERDFGWKPRVSIDAGLRRLWDWAVALSDRRAPVAMEPVQLPQQTVPRSDGALVRRSA